MVALLPGILNTSIYVLGHKCSSLLNVYPVWKPPHIRAVGKCFELYPPADNRRQRVHEMLVKWLIVEKNDWIVESAVELLLERRNRLSSSFDFVIAYQHDYRSIGTRASDIWLDAFCGEGFIQRNRGFWNTVAVKMQEMLE